MKLCSLSPALQIASSPLCSSLAVCLQAQNTALFCILVSFLSPLLLCSLKLWKSLSICYFDQPACDMLTSWTQHVYNQTHGVFPKPGPPPWLPASSNGGGAKSLNHLSPISCFSGLVPQSSAPHWFRYPLFFAQPTGKAPPLISLPSPSPIHPPHSCGLISLKHSPCLFVCPQL